MTEAKLYQVIKNCYTFKFVRIETGMTALGIADVYYYGRTIRTDGWIELKQVSNLTRRFKVPWRPGQLPRCNDLVLAGVRVVLLITDRKNRYAAVYGEPFGEYYEPEQLTWGPAEVLKDCKLQEILTHELPIPRNC